MRKLDRNDAPAGTKAYKADGRRGYSCCDCHFNKGDCTNVAAPCLPVSRRDRHTVVFFTPEEHRKHKEQ